MWMEFKTNKKWKKRKKEEVGQGHYTKRHVEKMDEELEKI